jgi:hypothetical protein
MSATKLLVLGIVHLSGGAHEYQVRSELQSPWLPLACLVVAAVIARARWSRTEAVVGTLLRR